MIIRPEKRLLFGYFIIIILTGTILLLLPFSWRGTKPLSLIDAFFTATSAVCVTGLTTVDTADYSLFGKIIILLLIQAGGLGIISFTTIYLILPSLRISFQQRKLVKDFFLDSVEVEPQAIMKQIIAIVFVFEFIGAVFLFIGFYPDLKHHAFFAAIFHSVSAFCNAGFSTFHKNFEGFQSNIVINITIMILIIFGGLGFIVIRDLIKRIRKKKRLALHTKIVLLMTVFLIIIPAIFYLIIEYHNAYSNLSFGEKILAALFQAITPRTAGFSTINQKSLSEASKFMTIPLMYIGANTGSTGGGVKTTTFFIVILLSVIGSKREDGIIVFKRKIKESFAAKASALMLKILLLISFNIFILLITEILFYPSASKNFLSLTFEAFSAFGTVGLSLGATPELSIVGKIIIIFLMFEGKVGLISLALTAPEKTIFDSVLDYPEGEVLIG